MAQDNPKKMMRSRAGLKITLNEESGHESFVVERRLGRSFCFRMVRDKLNLLMGIATH